MGTTFYGLTSPPAVYRDAVILGFSAGEGKPTEAPGDIRAFDVRDDGSLRTVEMRPVETTFQGEPVWVIALRDATEQRHREQRERHDLGGARQPETTAERHDVGWRADRFIRTQWHRHAAGQAGHAEQVVGPRDSALFLISYAPESEVDAGRGC